MSSLIEIIISITSRSIFCNILLYILTTFVAWFDVINLSDDDNDSWILRFLSDDDIVFNDDVVSRLKSDRDNESNELKIS